MANEDTLQIGEPHPAARDAMRWFNGWRMANTLRYMMAREAIASTALSGNSLAQVCDGTLDRLEKGEPVSDRYILGLAWFLKEMLAEEGNG